MPRKKKGQNLRKVTRLRKSFEICEESLKIKYEKKTLTSSSEGPEPTADDTSRQPPLKKRKIVHLVEDSPTHTKEKESSKPSEKNSRELKMLYAGNRNMKRSTDEENVGTTIGDAPQDPKISSGNRLLELDSLQDLIEDNTRCKLCMGTLSLNKKTLGIATRLELNCKKCKHKVTSKVERTTFKHDNSQETSESFLIYCLLVLGLQQIGCGASESGTLLTYLNLPHAHGFHRHSFRKIESAMRLKIKEICVESMEEALEEEVRLTINEERDKEERYANNQLTAFDIPLTVGYDMGWNKQSSGRIYNSISGYGIMIWGALEKNHRLSLHLQISFFLLKLQKKEW